MSLAANANLSLAPNAAFGYVVFWGIAVNAYDIHTLKSTAISLNLPQEFIDAIKGVEKSVAFKAATDLSTVGAKVVGLDQTKRYKLTTKKVIDNKIDNPRRILALEQLDEKNVVLDVTQLGVLELDQFQVRYNAQVIPHDPAIGNRVDTLIAEMAADYLNRVGKISDVGVRKILTDWCVSKHRVALRNNGGIYFIPSSPQIHAPLSAEITALSQWFALCNIGNFSSLELFPTAATSVTDIVDSSVQELKEALTESKTALNGYASNHNMNAGSRAVSAASQVAKLQELLGKVDALQSCFGDKVITSKVEIEMALMSAKRMEANAKAQVDAGNGGKSLDIPPHKTADKPIFVAPDAPRGEQPPVGDQKDPIISPALPKATINPMAALSSPKITADVDVIPAANGASNGSGKKTGTAKSRKLAQL